MTPFYSDDWLTLYGGDCREVLAGLPADSVDCVVTSPPYWGLRDYGTATWEGGDSSCDHMEEVRPGSLNEGFNERWGNAAGDRKQETRALRPFKELCGKCGATRIDSQLGLERTPEEYVANMVAVFREVWRVLKPSGTCWLNLGDSYANAAAGGDRRMSDATTIGRSKGKDRRLLPHAATASLPRAPKDMPPGLKPKDLVGIPWRVAFALQADGWYLRSDIIWSKPNPMPESVTDRPTKSHEYLFLLTKSARYYFDADAVREAGPGSHARGPAPKNPENGRADRLGLVVGDTGRNIRSVWTIATRPYPGAHFAVFPPELPERCIKAGSSEKGVILDPFGGSGTVGMVANRLSRRAILIDLNPEYLKQQMRRNAQTPLGLTEGDAA